MAKPDAETILGLDDIRLEPIDIPEWDGDFFMKTLTGGQRDQFEVLCNGSRKNMRSTLACWSLCDIDGKRIFKDSQASLLSCKSGVTLDRILKAAIAINGLDDDELGDIEKN